MVTCFKLAKAWIVANLRLYLIFHVAGLLYCLL